MNVLMHAVTGFALAVLVADTNRQETQYFNRSVLIRGSVAFFIGIILHGILDYMPHCYPINSKVDVISSLLLMITTVLLAVRKFKFIIAASFAGNIFPDLLDLSSGILNKYLNLNLPIFSKLFPWHWPEYSGSIYKENCNASNLNHLMILALTLIICVSTREKIKGIFRR